MAKRRLCAKGCRPRKSAKRKKHCPYGVSKTTGKCLKSKRRRR